MPGGERLRVTYPGRMPPQEDGRTRSGRIGSTLALVLVPVLVLGVVGFLVTRGGRADVDAGHAATPHASSPSASASGATPETPLRPGETRMRVGIDGGPYTPVAQNRATDDYRCFLIDPGLDADAFLTGVRFLPGNPGVVHHAILYRVEPDQIPAAQALDSADDGLGWSCFGGPGLPRAAGRGSGPTASLDSAPWLAAWAPGGQERVIGGGLGVPMAAGSRAVLQVHYNLRGGTGSDDTAVDLRLAPGTADLTPLETMLLVAPVELPCLANESGPLCDRTASVFDTVRRYGEDSGRTIAGLQLLCDGDPLTPAAGPTQSCDRRVDEPITVYGAAGHMHLLGRSITVELNPGTPQARTVLDIPVWDFDDQSSRTLAEPVRVDKGDVLRVTCTHDAGLRQMLPSLQDVEPRYVTWGEGTTDEMCLGILSVTRP